MTLLSRYLLREQLKTLAWIFLVLVFLCLIFDFFERLDDLLENAVPLRVGLRYMTYRMPQFVIYVLPISLLLSTFITIGLLGRSNQLTAMKASGISGYFISRPLLSLAVALSFFSFIWAEILVPSSNRAASKIWQVEVKKTTKRALFTRNEIWFRSPSPRGLTLYHIGFLKIPSSKLPGPRLEPKATKRPPILKDVTVFRLNRDFDLVERIDASEMLWKDGKWVFSEGVRWHSDQSGTIRVQPFKRETIPLHERPEDFQWIERDVEEMGFFDLLRYLRRAKEEGQPVSATLTDLHFKVASSLFSFIVVLFTIPLAMMIPPRAGGLAMGVTLSMTIGFIYYLLMALGLALGHTGTLPPLFSAWAGNILFGLVGLWWMLHLRH
jgi:lipopolysaccharide export system permease protein